MINRILFKALGGGPSYIGGYVGCIFFLVTRACKPGGLIRGWQGQGL